MFRIIGQQSGRQMTDDDIATLSYEEKTTMLHNDPVLAARHFDHRHKAFFRIEILLRGSPHAHCLIWMADGPDMSTTMKAEIETYFGSKITAQLPPVVDSQVHWDTVSSILYKTADFWWKKQLTEMPVMTPLYVLYWCNFNQNVTDLKFS